MRRNEKMFFSSFAERQYQRKIVTEDQKASGRISTLRITDGIQDGTCLKNYAPWGRNHCTPPTPILRDPEVATTPSEKSARYSFLATDPIDIWGTRPGTYDPELLFKPCPL